MNYMITWILAFLAFEASGQTCDTSQPYAKGFIRTYEHSTQSFNLTHASAIDTDARGSAYVCGYGDGDPTDFFDIESHQSFIFKTDSKGAIVWRYLFYPMTYNYTRCSGIAWAGDNLAPAVATP